MSGYHAVLSPSGADRWMKCPGSVVLSDGIKDTSSTYADEGSAAHFLAAECLTSGRHPSEFLGRTICVDPETGESWKPEGRAAHSPTFEVTTDMAGYVNHYVQAVRKQADHAVLHLEQPLPLGSFTGEHDAFGTADAVVITVDGELQIHDLKFGMKLVSAERNRQLMMYALGAFDEYELAYPILSVRLFIHQPRVTPTADECPVSLEELEAFRGEVKVAAEKVSFARKDSRANGLWGELYLNPSEDTCRYCRAKPCQALDELVRTTVLADFDDDQELTPDAVQDATEALASAEPMLLAARMSVCGLIEQWIKAVRSRVEADLLAGEGVPGYKLVQGKMGNRQWVDPADAEATLKGMRLKVEEMYDLSLISPTTAEKLSKATDDKGKPVIGPRQWKKLQKSITRKEGGLSVAPESDKRPAVDMSPKVDDFDDLEDDLI